MPTPLPPLYPFIAYVLYVAATTCAFQLPSPAVVAVSPSITSESTSSRSAVIGSIRSRRRLCMSFEGGDTRTALEVDLYNDDGDEIDVEIDLEDIEEDMNEYYSSADGGAGEVAKASENKKKLIECSATIMLPFSENVAFDAFSDLTRQPSWCKYLYAVEYLGLLDESETDPLDSNKVDSSSSPLRKSKWTVGIKGVRYSWTARDTRIVRPNRIEWESISGLRNMGSVEFVSQNNNNSPSSLSSPPAATAQMTMHFTFAAPRVVSSLFRRSGKIRKYTEDVIMMGMLTDFRDIVMEEDL
mmetsp:Transcript_14682/g.35382  ORF Transcript_14682/g.35382 Transcript_14682/m.35382 type:complete len:299 (+) Transcript_14682:165-1061(+)